MEARNLQAHGLFAGGGGWDQTRRPAGGELCNPICCAEKPVCLGRANWKATSSKPGPRRALGLAGRGPLARPTSLSALWELLPVGGRALSTGNWPGRLIINSCQIVFLLLREREREGVGGRERRVGVGGNK